MGGKVSAEEKAAREKDKQISDVAAKDAAKDKQNIKILLLGAGESGKSTLLKQMKFLYGTPVVMNESRIQAVRQNIASNMLKLLEATDKYVPIANKDLMEQRELLEKLSDLVPDEWKLTQSHADALKELWNDEGKVYIRRLNSYSPVECNKLDVEYY